MDKVSTICFTIIMCVAMVSIVILMGLFFLNAPDSNSTSVYKKQDRLEMSDG